MATPTSTPDAATIMQRAQQAKINDGAFTMTLNASTSSGTFTGTADGKITTSPKRTDVSFKVTVAGQQVEFEVIQDGATNTSYTKFTSPPLLASRTWRKSTGGASLIDPSAFVDYSHLSNLTLVGKDSVNGVPVWHLKGASSSSTTGGTADVYVRQDDYYPVKIVAHATGATSGDFTIVFTAINNGISISLPPADQVG